VTFEGGVVVTAAMIPDSPFDMACGDYQDDSCAHCDFLGPAALKTTPSWGKGSFVVVFRRIGGDVVSVAVSEPDLTGDPRDLDLALSVDDAVSIAQDPDLAPLMPGELVNTGASYPQWHLSPR
jgi:hypothetical protein